MKELALCRDAVLRGKVRDIVEAQLFKLRNAVKTNDTEPFLFGIKIDDVGRVLVKVDSRFTALVGFASVNEFARRHWNFDLCEHIPREAWYISGNLILKGGIIPGLDFVV